MKFEKIIIITLVRSKIYHSDFIGSLTMETRWQLSCVLQPNLFTITKVHFHTIISTSIHAIAVVIWPIWLGAASVLSVPLPWWNWGWWWSLIQIFSGLHHTIRPFESNWRSWTVSFQSSVYICSHLPWLNWWCHSSGGIIQKN